MVVSDLSKIANSQRSKRRKMNDSKRFIQKQEYRGKSRLACFVTFGNKSHAKLFQNEQNRFDRPSAFSKPNISSTNLWHNLFEMNTNSWKLKKCGHCLKYSSI
jgi:hypothetical protein